MTPLPLSTQPQPSTATAPPRFRTTAREFANPVDYQHPHPSMAQFADWKPKTPRQTVAATRLFFVDLLHHRDWTLSSMREHCQQ